MVTAEVAVGELAPPLPFPAPKDRIYHSNVLPFVGPLVTGVVPAEPDSAHSPPHILENPVPVEASHAPAVALHW